MESSDGDKIGELLDLERENNKILRGMHRSLIWGQVMTVIYWLIILGVAGWSYYYFQPYISKYLNTYQTIIKMFDQLQQKSGELSNLIPPPK